MWPLALIFIQSAVRELWHAATLAIALQSCSCGELGACWLHNLLQTPFPSDLVVVQHSSLPFSKQTKEAYPRVRIGLEFLAAVYWAVLENISITSLS